MTTVFQFAADGYPSSRLRLLGCFEISRTTLIFEKNEGKVGKNSRIIWISSPVLDDNFMEIFEEVASQSFRYTPKACFRYVDYTSIFLPRGKNTLHTFPQHHNIQYYYTKFTMEIESINTLNQLVSRSPNVIQLTQNQCTRIHNHIISCSKIFRC